MTNDVLLLTLQFVGLTTEYSIYCTEYGLNLIITGLLSLKILMLCEKWKADSPKVTAIYGHMQDRVAKVNVVKRAPLNHLHAALNYCVAVHYTENCQQFLYIYSSTKHY